MQSELTSFVAGERKPNPLQERIFVGPSPPHVRRYNERRTQTDMSDFGVEITYRWSRLRTQTSPLVRFSQADFGFLLLQFYW